MGQKKKLRRELRHAEEVIDELDDVTEDLVGLLDDARNALLDVAFGAYDDLHAFAVAAYERTAP